ncbi:hypothetical protein BC938DRAFT_474989, partial [Jimgerdemannia flammicorona]
MAPSQIAANGIGIANLPNQRHKIVAKRGANFTLMVVVWRKKNGRKTLDETRRSEPTLDALTRLVEMRRCHHRRESDPHENTLDLSLGRSLTRHAPTNPFTLLAPRKPVLLTPSSHLHTPHPPTSPSDRAHVLIRNLSLLFQSGESGLGKTTFINTLFTTAIKDYKNESRRHLKQLDRTVEIEITKAGESGDWEEVAVVDYAVRRKSVSSE